MRENSPLVGGIQPNVRRDGSGHRGTPGQMWGWFDMSTGRGRLYTKRNLRREYALNFEIRISPEKNLLLTN